VGPSVRTLCRDFGTPGRVNSAPYQLQALPCGDRAADRQEAADSSPFAPVISLLREALSQRPMGGLCSSLNLLRSVMSGKAPFPTGQV
jgi:hypothetical protein